MAPTWGIVMTVSEPSQLVLANIGWHLGTGASEVHVYLDSPEDPVAAVLADLPGVSVIRCDRAHWQRVAWGKERPASINRRQGLNAMDAMTHCGVDWLVHLDADEFLLQERPLAEEMAVVRALACELHFPVFERCYRRGDPIAGLFDGVFRGTTKQLNRRKDGLDTEAVIFGDQMPVLNNGVLGHSAGKCAVPTDGDFRLGLHWAYRGKRGRERAERYRSTSTRLLHFDGLTRLHFLAKLLRYRDTDPSVLKLPPHRQAQIGIFQDIAGDTEGLVEFHSMVRELDDPLLARLRAFGLLYETSFDPAPVVKTVLGYLPDLSAAQFDADLRARVPGLPETL